MKVGNENRAKMGLMLGLLIVAAVSVWRWLSGPVESPAASGASASAVNTPTKRDPRNRHILVKKGGAKGTRVIASLDPTLRFDLLRSSEDRSYTGGNRNIFQAHQEQVVIPRPITPVITPPINTGPPPPPPPPPINLKFYGFANKPGETKQIFLSSGDDVFVAREGEIVNRRYRVVHIGSNSVDIEDVLNNNRQSIPLTPG